MDEIRIYYESLEQGNHFIKKIFEKAKSDLNIDVPIKLVKLKGSSTYYSKFIAPIIFWKNPDIMVTIIKNEIEYPVLVIEFSNAVFTEDHELQRFDGIVAAADNNAIYIKISPTDKESQSAHGGNIDFDYLKPYKVILDKTDKLFYHFDWECRSGIVLVDEEYLSCPENIPEFEKFILILVEFFNDLPEVNNEWITEFQENLLEERFFSEWYNSVNNCVLDDLNNLTSSRTIYDSETDFLTLKLNRFGHAMDPERGMLAYYGTIHNNMISKMKFSEENNAWYKDTPNEQVITDYINENNLTTGFDYLKCFQLGSGLQTNSDFSNIVSNYESNTNILLNINLSDFLNNNYGRLNKALRTIFKYSNKLQIVNSDNILTLEIFWDNVNEQETNNDVLITPVRERETFDEDDVTYLSVHNFLIPNNYKILAVSYPGAQADRVVLVAPGTGRRQQRRYIDIISYLPNRFTSLQENKGKYTPAQIQKEIYELKKYKNEQENIQAIESFMTRYDDEAPSAIKIGVGFWANSRFQISSIQSLDINGLDYFIFITADKTRWQVWNTGESMFEITEGTVEIPDTFEVY